MIFDIESELNESSYRDRIHSKYKKQSETTESGNISEIQTSIVNYDNTVLDSTFLIQVDEKINCVCAIDREYKETLSLSNKAKQSAEQALETAEKAAEKSAGIGKKKRAIEALQTAQKEQAIANDVSVQAISKIAKLQEKIIEATKALFLLGTSSIAANRSVYRQLELQLKGASDEQLSDFAQKELQAVMQQLNDQQDVMAKHNKLSEVVHSQQEQVERQQQLIDELRKQQVKQQEQFQKELDILKKQLESFSDNNQKDEPADNIVETIQKNETSNTIQEKPVAEDNKKEKDKKWIFRNKNQ